MSRVAVTVAFPDLDVAVEPRFGRATFLLLVEPETMTWEALGNPDRDARGGAGIRVAQLLSENEVSAVVSGDFGPSAHEALSAAGIVMYRCESGIQARKAVELMTAGKLAEAEPHSWPRRRRWGRVS